MGNLIGSLLPADVYARYLRLLGKDVVAICGTDEHGTPAELSALEEGLPVKEYCDKYYKIQKRIYEDFGLSYDHFGRTSSEENHKITQDLFLKLWNNGYIKVKEDKQLYCKIDERYLPDRYVTGTCPHCGYEKARGDQCEHCTKLLNPIELLNPICKVCGKSEIEIRDTRHLYLDLPKLEPKLREWIEKQTHWPSVTRSLALAKLKEGLIERPITRNLQWGIPVPLKEFSDLRFYVWFDAPNAYISITVEWAKKIRDPERWKKYWKDPHTKLIQFMGVDNVPFHTVTWPATLIGADDGYILAWMIKGFNWLTYEGGKFSTSENRGVFTDQALKLYPADYWRYYLLLIAPERQNTDFTWEGFQQAVNHDLNNQLGNFIQRTVVFVNKHFDGKIPSANLDDPDVKALLADINHLLSRYRMEMDNFEFQKTAFVLRELWQRANKFFQEREPWKAVKTNKEHAATTLSVSAHLARIIAIVSAPYIPFSSEKIFELLGYTDPKVVHKTLWENVIDFECLIGRKVKSEATPLFSKIKDKEIEELKQRFGARETSKLPKNATKKGEKTKKKKKTEKVSIEDFEKLDIRIGKVLSAEKIPECEKLLRLEVDIGGEVRQILTGLAHLYKPEELVGKYLPVLVNLKTKKIKQYRSEGMILVADVGNDHYVFLTPEKEVKPGAKVC